MSEQQNQIEKPIDWTLQTLAFQIIASNLVGPYFYLQTQGKSPQESFLEVCGAWTHFYTELETMIKRRQESPPRTDQM